MRSNDCKLRLKDLKALSLASRQMRRGVRSRLFGTVVVRVDEDCTWELGFSPDSGFEGESSLLNILPWTKHLYLRAPFCNKTRPECFKYKYNRRENSLAQRHPGQHHENMEIMCQRLLQLFGHLEDHKLITFQWVLGFTRPLAFLIS